MAHFHEVLATFGVLFGVNSLVASWMDTEGWERDFGRQAQMWRIGTVILGTLVGGASWQPFLALFH